MTESAPLRGYLVAESDGAAVGIALRAAESRMSSRTAVMCLLCQTGQAGDAVSLFTARRTGEAGRNGNTVGTYLCTDLACSLYARRLKQPDRVQPVETLSTEARVERLQTNLETFLRRVVDEA